MTTKPRDNYMYVDWDQHGRFLGLTTVTAEGVTRDWLKQPLPAREDDQ